jgi:HK97 family phage prohead protease
MEQTVSRKRLNDGFVRLDAMRVSLAAGESDSRTIDVVASTTEVNSYGLRMEQDWVLDRYLKNPVVLYNHSAEDCDAEAEDTLPIGRAENVRVEGGELKATIRFASAAANPLAEQVYQLMREGMLNAVSVGFWPGKVTFTEDDSEPPVLSACELYELSVVPVGADPGALATHRARTLETLKTFAAGRSAEPLKGHDAMAHFAALATILGLSATAGEAEVVAGMTAIKTEREELLRATGKSNVSEAIGHVEGLKLSAERGQAAITKLAELEADKRESDVLAICEEGRKAGKLSADQRKVYLSICGADEGGKGADPIKLRALVDALPSQIVTAPTETPPAGSALSITLSAEERKVASLMGVTEEQFIKSRVAERDAQKTEG